MSEVMSKEPQKARRPSLAGAVISLVIVISMVVAGIWMGIGSQMSLFLGATAAIVIALFFGNRWNDIQNEIVKTISNGTVAILIIMIVGITIGFWIVGGTVPALLYYGLNFITPQIILPLTFVLCAITSLFTGTSLGSIATMGLALVGVGIGIGVPSYMVAGAAVSGCFFGDKMSPMSDTTNMASGLSGTGLYDHIGSMLYTTVPAIVICLVAYTVIGWSITISPLQASVIPQLLSSLQEGFAITPIAMIPPLCVLVVSILRVPAILGLGGCSIISCIFAMVLQNKSFVDVFKIGYSGFKSNTGFAMLDTLLSRGGLASVSGTVLLILFACAMGGALAQSGVVGVLLEDFLFKIVKKPSSLVYSTMVYCYLILGLSGNQILGIVMGGPAFRDAYDKMDVDRKVLSRTLEDTCTIGSALVPWGIMAAYITSVLDVDLRYIPYSVLCYTVPIFTVLYAATGFGMWRSNGTKMWQKEKTGNQA